MPSTNFHGLSDHPRIDETPEAWNHHLGYQLKTRNGIEKGNPIAISGGPIMHIGHFKSDDCSTLVKQIFSGGVIHDLNNLAYYQNLSDLPQSSKVVGFWKLEEALQPFYDQTANHYDFTTSGGGVTNIPGKCGYGVFLNATGSYFITGGYFSPNQIMFANQSFTIAMWLKVDTAGQSGVLFSITDAFGGPGVTGLIGYWLGLENGKPVFSIDGVGTNKIVGNTVLQTGIWYLITGVYTFVGAGTSKMDIYVNKTVDALQVTGVPAVDYSSAGGGAPIFLQLGDVVAGGTPAVIGDYDEVAFWIGAGLIQADVTNLYNIPYG
jgi:hypothetical protein